MGGCTSLPKQPAEFQDSKNLDEERSIWEHLFDDSGNPLLENIRNDTIGHQTYFQTPFGKRRLLYADFVASGRLLNCIEQYLLTNFYPTYANTHTETSMTGKTTNYYREQSRQCIKECVNATENEAVIFAGNGVTGCVQIIMNTLLQKNRTQRIAIIHGPAEHHSLILPWRENFEHVFMVPIGNYQLDETWLEAELPGIAAEYDLVFCTFTYSSNVTGIYEDTSRINEICHRHTNVYIFWDMATAGPYLDINFQPPRGQRYASDGIFLSVHKFLGGPGSTGVLIAKRNFFDLQHEIPTMPGGGTVVGVTKDMTMYESKIEIREEAGTPNIIGSVKAACAMKFKSLVGVKYIQEREEQHLQVMLDLLRSVTNIQILGTTECPRLPIISFIIRIEDKVLHYNLVSQLLNDLFGIQSRGGCACAGPHAAFLLGLQDSANDILHFIVDNDVMGLKPGFTRINLHWTHTTAEVEFMAKAITFIAQHGCKFVHLYRLNRHTGNYAFVGNEPVLPVPTKRISDSSDSGSKAGLFVTLLAQHRPKAGLFPEIIPPPPLFMYYPQRQGSPHPKECMYKDVLDIAETIAQQLEPYTNVNSPGPYVNGPKMSFCNVLENFPSPSPMHE